MSANDVIKAALLLLRPTRLSGSMRSFAALFLVVIGALSAVTPSYALEAIVIGQDQERIDITLLGELYEGRGDRISVETAAGQDGVSGRMSISAKTQGTNPNWAIFALNNPTDQSVTLWLMAQRYDMVGSQVIWPDLDAPRIENVTVSLGFKPERVENDYADIYRLVLEPGSTITYIVELNSTDFPRLYLANPAVFGKKSIDLTLFNGILLGIAGVLAIYLTAIFGANHNTIFPAAALIAWSAVAYLCVDFGFWHKLFQLSAADNAIYRAATEAAIAASIVIFLYVFLQLRRWHPSLTVVFGVWALAQVSLVALALIDARLASGLARLSYVPIAAIGSLLMVVLALRGQERALSLLPSWMLFLVWLFGSSVTVLGQLSGDVIVPALNAGLVLIVALLSFTVTQYAFHGSEHFYGDDAGELQMGAVALEASGASVWEWNIRRDEIFLGPNVDAALGHPPGTLRGKVRDWLQHLHASDRERMKLILAGIRDKQGGEISTEFRLRRADGSYLHYELRAQTVVTRPSRILRCTGILRDITAQKRAQDRLLYNAIHDSLTGLPNRELFQDRIHCAIARAHQDDSKPTVIYIDIDTFQSLNRTTDFSVSDSMLLTISRRLSRHLGPQDTLARIGSEQFAVLLSNETEPRQIAMLAERVRRSLRAPMKIAGRDVVLTGSVGIAVYDGQQAAPSDLLREAETAMYRAKRSGADRIELYKPEMRGEKSEREIIENDLRQAIEKRQIRVLYQPVMRLGDDQLAGFSAQVRWLHPKLGSLGAAEFLPIAEESGQISEISTYVMERAVRQVARWHRTLPRVEDPLFVSVNISSHHLFKQDLIQDLRLIIGRESVPKGCLRLEVTESLIMENPEQAIEILDWLKGLGAGIALDEFGAGYSSLAYLHRLSVDSIKIDRSLISHGSDNKSGAVVLRAALAMARELGKDVVAVGLEREEDVAYVRALGCDYAQGFYFGEPVTERDVMSLLSALARSNKRDEKRQKKKKKLEDDTIVSAPPVSAPPIEHVAAQQSAASSAAASTVYSLPVPVSRAGNSSDGRGRNFGLLSAIRKRVGQMSVSSLGRSIFGLVRPADKNRRAKAAGRKHAASPQHMREPRPMRGHANQAEMPRLQEDRMRAPPVPGAPPSPSDAPKPEYAPPQSRPIAEAVPEAPQTNFRPPEPMRAGRRRRG
jgi:diguanylate cyclase (GGDEF)-like protein/PAS domain S-box-containing protein